jgi:hypothetical protein
MRAMLRRLLALTLFAALLALAACKGMPQKKVDMVAEFGNAVRWSDWDSAWNFVDPAKRSSTDLPVSEIDRLKDIKVTGYVVRLREPQPDGTMKQVVEIRYVEQATMRERTVRETQLWRTDDDGDHWWVDALPEF